MHGVSVARKPRFSKPTRFKIQRVVLAGFGQVAKTLLSTFEKRQFIATRRPSTPSQMQTNHRSNQTSVRRLTIDLNCPKQIERLAKVAHHVIWLAPPAKSNSHDTALASLARSLGKRNLLTASMPTVVYVSTTGVYGDLQGGWADERTPTNPMSERAKRRVIAENQLKNAYKLGQIHAKIIRAPGIYSENRLPTSRLAKGLPALRAQEDSYSNHIHELDLARTCFLALYKGQAWDVINAVDEHPCKMGDYFDQVATALKLDKPPRLSRVEAKKQVSPMMWSFMRESRRIQSRRLTQLGLKLAYPNVGTLLSKCIIE